MLFVLGKNFPHFFRPDTSHSAQNSKNLEPGPTRNDQLLERTAKMENSSFQLKIFVPLSYLLCIYLPLTSAAILKWLG